MMAILQCNKCTNLFHDDAPHECDVERWQRVAREGQQAYGRAIKSAFKPDTPQPPDMSELIAKELRQCEENGVADNALIRTSDGGYWRYWADSKSWHSVQAPWVALQARIDAAVARRKAKQEQAEEDDREEYLQRLVSEALEARKIMAKRSAPLARAMSAPLPHDPPMSARLMPWRGKE